MQKNLEHFFDNFFSKSIFKLGKSHSAKTLKVAIYARNTALVLLKIE